jgi:hypothetical protein
MGIIKKETIYTSFTFASIKYVYSVTEEKKYLSIRGDSFQKYIDSIFFPIVVLVIMMLIIRLVKISLKRFTALNFTGLQLHVTL